MDKPDGDAKKARKRSRPLNYFYLRGQMEPGGPQVPILHKKLHINRGADTIMAWAYPLGKRVGYTYSDVLRRKEPAYTNSEVSKMINRSQDRIFEALWNGDVAKPQNTYGLDENRNFYKYMWHEDNIMELHAFFSTVHRGRPRKDGIITPQRLPTARELRAMIRQEEILYVKDGDTFRPVWQAHDF